MLNSECSMARFGKKSGGFWPVGCTQVVWGKKVRFFAQGTHGGAKVLMELGGDGGGGVREGGVFWLMTAAGCSVRDFELKTGVMMGETAPGCAGRGGREGCNGLQRRGWGTAPGCSVGRKRVHRGAGCGAGVGRRMLRDRQDRFAHGFPPVPTLLQYRTFTKFQEKYLVGASDLPGRRSRRLVRRRLFG